ncbi:MAG: EamA family transporter [Synergistaceae bacterium]|jgi:drug/metabolite transporter (DMT)-like permease|nr:EamA family transporter [Synergistaceae bacterium]
MTDNPEKTVPKTTIAACYFAIYIIWGSTYLAMSISFKTAPILLANAIRFLSAGTILSLLAHWNGAAKPTRANMSVAAHSGVLAFFAAYVLLSWAQKTLPSSTAALLVSLEPAWFVLFDWIFFGGPKPHRVVVAAQAVGMIGCVILVIGEGAAAPAAGGSAAAYVISSAAVVISSFSWVCGALLSSKSRNAHPSTAMASGLQMMCGGAVFAVISASFGDFSRIGDISGESWFALFYLVVFGSIVTYSAYVLLLRTQPASKVSTHSFVNPIVALVLGAAMADERITKFTVIAAALIVSSIVMIIRHRR